MLIEIHEYFVCDRDDCKRTGNETYILDAPYIQDFHFSFAVPVSDHEKALLRVKSWDRAGVAREYRFYEYFDGVCDACKGWGHKLGDEPVLVDG